VAVPDFSVSVKLSELAQKQLQRMQEQVLVIAYFDGEPLPGQGKDNSPFRGVFLGSDEKLTDKENIATFHGTKLSQSNWNHLSNKDYFVTINVVSARKFSKDNVLHYGVPENRVSTFAGKTTEVTCRMIGES
jgi:hypothetical protein